jgi:hypothetical protein
MRLRGKHLVLMVAGIILAAGTLAAEPVSPTFKNGIAL